MQGRFAVWPLIIGLRITQRDLRAIAPREKVMFRGHCKDDILRREQIHCRSLLSVIRVGGAERKAIFGAEMKLNNIQRYNARSYISALV